jgi:hypothetical protein
MKFKCYGKMVSKQPEEYYSNGSEKLVQHWQHCIE